MEGKEMKGKKRKKRKVSLFIVTLTILIPLLFSMPTALAYSQTAHFSFDAALNEPPGAPINSYPPDGAINIELPVILETVVTDESSATVNVYFYNGNDDSLIGVDNNVSTYWSTATATVNWSGLQKGTSYSWYAVTNDSEYENMSRRWSFSTKSDSEPTPPSPGYNPPPNQAPVANITGPLTGYVNETVIFCAYYSYDSDGYIAGYRWDFNNDGLFDTDWEEEMFASHIYSSPGNYTVKLQIKDNDDATSMDSYIITIIALEPYQQLPVAQINGPYKGFLHENISFDGTGSYDPDGIIVKYEWKFGDRNAGNGVNPRHKYNQAGEYIVILTVTDDDGLTDISATKATIVSIIKEVYIDSIKHYLVDTNGDNCIDAFYNSATKETTATNKTDDGLYLIDEDGDGSWDYIYDDETEELLPYVQERVYPLELCISIIIALIVTVIVVMIILRKRRYYFR